MSNLDDVPELSPEAKAFLQQHAQTGEPSAEALARGRSRLQRPVYRVARVENRVRPERSWRALKMIAAAAMVAIAVGAGGMGLMHSRERSKAASVAQIGEAYRQNRFEEALSLARRCGEPVCLHLFDDLNRARSLVERFDTLTPGELAELRTLEFSIRSWGDPDHVMNPRFHPRDLSQTSTGSSPLPPGLLASDAKDAMKSRNYRGAVMLSTRCLTLDPKSLQCTRLLASAYALISAEDNDVNALRQSRAYYEHYLEIAPADDPYVEKIRNILQSAPAR